MNLPAILGGLLALSVLANVAIGSAYLEKRDEVAAQRESIINVVDDAKACSQGVHSLQLTTAARFAEAAASQAQAAGTVKSLERKAQAALSAKPIDPADLCKSAREFLRQEIAQERAEAPGATK
jgi:hypothetical protein